MKANRRKHPHRVTLMDGLKIVASGTYNARTPGAAVHQFRKAHQVTLKTDHETGGWLNVTVECP